jgi:dCMP deaminase
MAGLPPPIGELYYLELKNKNMGEVKFNSIEEIRHEEMRNDKWNQRFMRIADLEVAQWSKDRSSRVGCVIVKDRRIISTGYNGMARGLDDSVEERHERPEKYEWFLHAEPNGIINAAREGVCTMDADMYLNWYPCNICAGYVVQAGIKRIFCDQEPEWEDEKWGPGFKRAQKVLLCGGVEVIFMNYDAHRKGLT